MPDVVEPEITEETPREWTVDEVRDKFLHQLRTYVQYWFTLPGRSLKDRFGGLAFSTLVLLDGGTDLPGFVVTPAPHPTDKDYNISRGANWFPESNLEADIAGALHEKWHQYFENIPDVPDPGDTITRLRSEIANKDSILRRKNLELDALHMIWCSGPCREGVHRWTEGELTDEMAKTVWRYLVRFLTKHSNFRFKEMKEQEEMKATFDLRRLLTSKIWTASSVELAYLEEFLLSSESNHAE
jgi:hypothetical protein